MLRTETVERTTLELLKTLMQDEKLEHFNLVGGTALALYMGHRKSIDLDLFSFQEFDNIELEKHLNNKYNFEVLNPEKRSTVVLTGVINGIKVDCVQINNPLVNPVNHFDGIRIYSMQDISAMKLVAMSQNGTRLKDFVDVAFLSAKMSFKEMLDTFEKKYPKTNKISAIKGMTYFDDIDFSAKIDLIEGTFKWKKIEKRLNEMIKHPDRVFPQMDFNDVKPSAIKTKRTKMGYGK